MKLNNFPANFSNGSTSDFKPCVSMLRNHFGSHVLSDLLLLEDVQSIRTKNILVHRQYATLNKACAYPEDGKHIILNCYV